jgi:hypothetical protein
MNPALPHITLGLSFNGFLLALALGMLAAPHAALAQATSRPEPDAHGKRATSPTPAASSDALRAALARYEHEPSIAQVLRAAVHANHSSTHDELRHRARLSGLVPVLGLKARRGQAVDLASSAADDGLRLSTDDDLTLEAAMTFHLARTVFASEEVALSREARAERADASKRAAEIIRLYFERRRLQLERDLLTSPRVAKPSQPRPPPSLQGNGQASQPPSPSPGPPTSPDVERVSRDTHAPDAPARTGQSAPASQDAGAADLARIVRIAEIEAQLDVFTGGAFRRMMRR